ncbi:MAG: type II toxin-antitoxin system MqsA family antitoxin [Gammaproteobacteria bacterium]|nr:type II toxin-antitoxin system MqsA family antitoxin [Gammaproteobacteria bacterium]
MKNNSNIVSSPKETCPLCGSEQVTRKIHGYDMEYGSGEEIAKIWVKIPLYNCPQCKIEYKNWEAEEIEHNALCKHFGVLNPDEIKQIREKYQMKRNAFAQLTGIGEASLSRWEKSLNIQNIANDRYLRLLRNPEIFKELQSIVHVLELSDLDSDENIIPFRHIQQRRDLGSTHTKFELRKAI